MHATKYAQMRQWTPPTRRRHRHRNDQSSFLEFWFFNFKELELAKHSHLITVRASGLRMQNEHQDQI
jgi:hypothetical protein